MVSKASDDLPLPERPVTTTRTSRGSETVMFFRLCSRAPWTTIRLSAIFCSPLLSSSLGKYTAPAREAQGSIQDVQEFSRILVEEFGALCLAPGDTARPVRGPAVEEPAKGWLAPDEVAITSRERLDDGFLQSVSA